MLVVVPHWQLDYAENSSKVFEIMDAPKTHRPPDSAILEALVRLADWANSNTDASKREREATLLEIATAMGDVQEPTVNWALYLCSRGSLLTERTLTRDVVPVRNRYTVGTRSRPTEFAGVAFVPQFFEIWRQEQFPTWLSSLENQTEPASTSATRPENSVQAAAAPKSRTRNQLIIVLAVLVLGLSYFFNGCSQKGDPPTEPPLRVELVGDENNVSKAEVDVIFVHGLSGDLYSTWTNDRKDFWPTWLSEDLNGKAAVWTLGYEAAITKWDGGAMPLTDRATSVLNLLGRSSRTSFGKRPIIFVTHSLGGLVVKKCLQTGLTVSGDESMKKVADGTIGIVFFSTPHSGSDKANWLNFVAEKCNVSISDASEDLRRNNATLRELHQWYQNNCRSRLKTLVFYEKEPLGLLGLIVDERSAQDNLSPDPIPRDANHISVCKFSSRRDYEDSGVLKFMQEKLNAIRENRTSVDSASSGPVDVQFQISVNGQSPKDGKLAVFDDYKPAPDDHFTVFPLPESNQSVPMRRSGSQTFVYETFSLRKPTQLAPMSSEQPWAPEEYSITQEVQIPPDYTMLNYTDHHRTRIVAPLKGDAP